MLVRSAGDRAPPPAATLRPLSVFTSLSLSLIANVPSLPRLLSFVDRSTSSRTLSHRLLPRIPCPLPLFLRGIPSPGRGYSVLSVSHACARARSSSTQVRSRVCSISQTREHVPYEREIYVCVWIYRATHVYEEARRTSCVGVRF